MSPWVGRRIVRQGRRRIRRRLRPVRWGNLRRLEPVTSDWGLSRGTPIDRVYIESFLEQHRSRVQGRVLEVQDADYTRRFGDGHVEHSDVIDIDPANPHATIITDLGVPGALPVGAFDCIILTQTVQLIADARTALRNAYAALAPGGVILLTTHGTSMAYETADRWRWTPDSLELDLRETAPGAQLEVTGHGNVLAATAHLWGLAAEDLTTDELAYHDPRFPVIVTALVERPSA